MQLASLFSLITIMQNQTLSGVSLVLAPLLMFVSGFFWINGEYGVKGGTMLIVSSIFWIITMFYLFGSLRDKLPGIAQVGILLSVFGFVSGGLFGFVGVLAEILSIPHETYIRAFEKYPISSGILLFWTGPLAPLSLILIGILLLKTKKTENWVAIMILFGGVVFPAGRISRNEWLAHIADLFLLVPVAYLGIQILLRRR